MTARPNQASARPRPQVRGPRRGKRNLVVDLTRVTFLDSAMLHAMFRALRRSRLAGGGIAVVCVDPKICRLLEIFGLTVRMPVFDSAAAAAAALAPQHAA